MKDTRRLLLIPAMEILQENGFRMTGCFLKKTEAMA